MYSKLVKTEIGLILKLCELIYGVGTTRHYNYNVKASPQFAVNLMARLCKTLF